MVTLVLDEPRRSMAPILEGVISGIDGIELIKEDASSFSMRRDLDAYIVNQWFAHERYGYEFVRTGISEVLSTKGDTYAPPWVVTTPSFPLHLEFSDTEDAKVARDKPVPSPEEEAYIMFSLIFEAVEQFNLTSAVPKISRLGCDLKFMGIPHSSETENIERELRNIVRAYSDHRERLARS